MFQASRAIGRKVVVDDDDDADEGKRPTSGKLKHDPQSAHFNELKTITCSENLLRNFGNKL